MNSRFLVVYYTRTGTTKKVAGEIAAALDADLDEIVDPTKRSGPVGYLRSGLEATLQRSVPIAPAVHHPANYELVVVGTPIWNLSVSSPVRSYLNRHRGSFRNVAFFCTCGGRGGERAFAQMAELGNAKPVATLVVREADAERSMQAVDRFTAEIERALVGVTPPPPSAPSPTIPLGPATTKP